MLCTHAGGEGARSGRPDDRQGHQPISVALWLCAPPPGFLSGRTSLASAGISNPDGATAVNTCETVGCLGLTACGQDCLSSRAALAELLLGLCCVGDGGGRAFPANPNKMDRYLLLYCRLGLTLDGPIVVVVVHTLSLSCSPPTQLHPPPLLASLHSFFPPESLGRVPISIYAHMRHAAAKIV
ncbi:uncharacterized protein An18g00970 [Aspergillus niger]|uniref:Contig An18c0040, genomic contig n=2 Tax=Aspergillus niger TaxID=5061 RepID=E2PSZ9_ASPNC|nr:uncharacterized protein An18g00970 [Aspergillus niger]CAK47174.1 unnamed protein product [Aspergillus niger]